MTEARRSTTLPTKRFLSDLDVEAMYGIPRKTLQNWRVLGRAPIYRKFGNGVRYDIRDLEAWIDSLPSGGAGVPSCMVKGKA
jgi:predicted DNA-binding transcriptional regulator AlpA